MRDVQPNTPVGPAPNGVGRGRLIVSWLLALIFSCLLVGWLIAALESYVLLLWFGLSSSLRVAYVMESVGSMFRLIFFFVPAGIGGQDASFVALFKLYGFPGAEAGAFVLLKRCKELVWTGAGLILAFLHRGPRADAGTGTGAAI